VGSQGSKEASESLEETSTRGREVAAPSFIKEIQEVQGGQEVPHDGSTIIPKDA